MKKYIISLIITCLFVISLGIIYSYDNKIIIHKTNRNKNSLDMIHYKEMISVKRLYKLRQVKVAVIDEGIREDSMLKFKKLYFKNSQFKGHGTVITHLLASDYNPKIHFQGIIPGMPIYGYSFSTTHVTTNDLATAINEVIKWNVDIINISMGSNESTPELRKAVQKAVQKGVVLVCSSGNSPYSLNYPASYDIPGIISVGAVGNNYDILPFTTVNSNIDIYAPGQNIRSISERGGDLTPYSGTSVAVPFVTMACVYIKAFAPSLKPDQVEKFLVKHSDLYRGKWRNDSEEIHFLNMEKIETALHLSL